MYERTINLMRTINFQDKLFSRNFKRKVLLEIARQWGREVKPGSRANKQNADHASRASDSDSENSASCSGPTAGKAALSASAPPSSCRGRAVHSATHANGRMICRAGRRKRDSIKFGCRKCGDAGK